MDKLSSDIRGDFPTLVNTQSFQCTGTEETFNRHLERQRMMNKKILKSLNADKVFVNGKKTLVITGG